MAIINSKIKRNLAYRYTFSGSTGYADKNGESIPESFITKSVADNFNVSKPIPASDHQYTWITASLELDDRIEHSLGYVTSSNGLLIISSSEYTDPLSDERGWVPNYPINLLRTDASLTVAEAQETLWAAGYEVTESQYIAQMNGYYTSQPTRTKAFISRMNGPYQNPSWRTTTHAVLQSLKRTSNLVLMDAGLTKYNGNKQVRERFGQTQTRYNVPYISTKFRPLLHGYEEDVVVNEDIKISNPINLSYDYSSQLANFPIDEIDNRLGLDKQFSVIYETLYDNYTNNAESRVGDFRIIRYREVVWPRERNTFLGQIRNRSQFYFNWRDLRSQRTINSASNSQGKAIPTSSIWPLDARSGPYSTETLFTTASTIHVEDSSELMSVGSVYHNGTVALLTASALFSFPMPDSSSVGVFFTNDTVFNVGS